MATSDSQDPNLLQELKLELMHIAGVQAVGESKVDDHICLKVYFDTQNSLDSANLLESKNGIRLEGCVGGNFLAQ